MNNCRFLSPSLLFFWESREWSHRERLLHSCFLFFSTLYSLPYPLLVWQLSRPPLQHLLMVRFNYRFQDYDIHLSACLLCSGMIIITTTGAGAKVSGDQGERVTVVWSGNGWRRHWPNGNLCDEDIHVYWESSCPWGISLHPGGTVTSIPVESGRPRNHCRRGWWKCRQSSYTGIL